ncbi:MAG TPA: hypothetical protein VI356_25330 [Myxococcales bacterium]
MEKKPTQFDALMRRLERVLNTIQELKYETRELEWERDALKKMLRGYASGSPPQEQVDIDHLFPSSRKRSVGLSDAIKEAVEAVRDSQRTVDPEWLAAKLKIGRDAAAIRLVRAHQAGLLSRPARGKYFFPRSGAGEAAAPPDVNVDPEEQTPEAADFAEEV